MENQKTKGTIASQPMGQRRSRMDDTINLVEIFYLLWGHVWQIILCLFLGAVMTFSYTYFCVTPLYQASTRIYIVSASNDSVVNLSDLQVGSQLTADYQELILLRPVLEDVIDNLSLPMEYEELSRMITITNTSDTRILKITVTSDDPRQAADIANEMAVQAGIYLPRIMETDPPNIAEEAIIPRKKSSPSYSRNTMMGGMLGAILCCGILIVRYLMNDTFVTPDDVEKYLGIQPLATIPEGDLGDFNRKESRKKEKRRREDKGSREKTV